MQLSGMKILVRGAIADVAGKCPYTDHAAKVLCERIKLLLWKIGRKTVNIDIGYALLVRVGFSSRGYIGRVGINSNPGNRIG
jgi:hypothetical protein